MAASWCTERGVSPSPQVLTRGNTFFSTRATDQPARASQCAHAAPLGPAPTTTTSKVVEATRGFSSPGTAASLRGGLYVLRGELRRVAGVTPRTTGRGDGSSAAPGESKGPATANAGPDRASVPAAGGPLTGVRVVELASVIMTPYAGQLLGDLGADVIKVEHAGVDSSRVMGGGPHTDLSGIALNLHRNKRSLFLDVKTPQGRDAFGRLLAGSDVLLT